MSTYFFEGHVNTYKLCVGKSLSDICFNTESLFDEKIFLFKSRKLYMIGLYL